MEEATREAAMGHETILDTNDDEDDDDDVFPTAVHLESLFLYQNNLTGQVSTTHLTARQLCRILCPVSVSTSAQQHLRHLTPATNLLLQEPDGSYCQAGWKPAMDVPVLREAVTLWYYCSASSCTETATTSATTTATTATTVSPAVSCRALAAVVKNRESSSKIHFSSRLTKSEWKTLDQLPNLQTALEAFDETPSFSDPVNEPREQTFDGDVNTANGATTEVQLELDAFLKSTTNAAEDSGDGDGDEDGKEESYESDGGTRYVKDSRTGNWVHEALVAATTTSTRNRPLQKESSSKASHSSTATNGEIIDTKPYLKRKQKTAKFSAKKGRCWIYVTGLPVDCTEDEVAERFAKAGLLDLDPETQRPKIKLYRHKHADHPDVVGKPKGDASICYARPESVALAVTLLDGTPFRTTSMNSNNNDTALLMTVHSAKFEQHGEQFDGSSRGRVSNAKRKVAKLATMQAIDWDDGEFNGRLTGGRKGLRIIVLKHLFDPSRLAQSSEEEQDRLLGALEQDLRAECERWGVVEKITFFSQNPQGVAVVKLTQPGAASDAVKELNGRLWKERRIEACFWDGVTDYTVKDVVKEAKASQVREEEFGNWLESQELPEELLLKTE